MTTQRHYSENSSIPPEALATLLGIPLSVTASKHQPLLTASALANANLPQRTSSAHSWHQQPPAAVAPSESHHHSKKKPDLNQRSTPLRQDHPTFNVHYDDIMQN